MCIRDRFDTLAELMNVPYLTRRYGGIEPARVGLAHPSIAPYGVFSLDVYKRQIEGWARPTRAGSMPP